MHLFLIYYALVSFGIVIIILLIINMINTIKVKKNIKDLDYLLTELFSNYYSDLCDENTTNLKMITNLMQLIRTQIITNIHLKLNDIVNQIKTIMDINNHSAKIDCETTTTKKSNSSKNKKS